LDFGLWTPKSKVHREPIWDFGLCTYFGLNFFYMGALRMLISIKPLYYTIIIKI
jgi:hypothetical protein